jgi:hypothetical protein
MNRRRLLRILAVVSVLEVFLGTEGHASAQLLGPTIGGILNPRRRLPQRPPAQKPFWVNREDCIKDDVLTFSFTLGGTFVGLQLEVWAGGADCSPTTARVGTTATCWKVAAESPGATPFSIAIRARDIVAANKPGATGAVPNQQGIIQGTLEDCLDTSTTPAQSIALDFMFVNAASSATLPGHQLYQMGYDIWGPPPPTGVTATPGETRLKLGWTRPTTTDIIRYDIYCDPPAGVVPDQDSGLSGLMPLLFPPLPGLRTLADAGLGGSGGAGGAGAGGSSLDAGAGGTTARSDAGIAPTGPTCGAAAPLTPGVLADSTLDAYRCGSVDGLQATSATIEGLVNDVPYTVAVVGVDQVLNAGVLSGQACEKPIEVTDFFELYRQAGGTGGGGLCSIAAPERRTPMLGLLASVVAAAWLARRRIRQRR